MFAYLWFRGSVCHVKRRIVKDVGLKQFAWRSRAVIASASEAIHLAAQRWIASSQMLLAMTVG
jgi:hypothetical protein